MKILEIIPILSRTNNFIKNIRTLVMEVIANIFHTFIAKYIFILLSTLRIFIFSTEIIENKLSLFFQEHEF